MILIVGGESSGKREYAKSLGYKDEEMSCDIYSDAKVIYGIEKAVMTEAAEKLLDLMVKKEVVICCEVGSGIIPLDERDRKHREAVGRLSIMLAKEAESVIRTVCGIATVIK